MSPTRRRRSNVPRPFVEPAKRRDPIDLYDLKPLLFGRTLRDEPDRPKSRHWSNEQRRWRMKSPAGRRPHDRRNTSYRRAAVRESHVRFDAHPAVFG